MPTSLSIRPLTGTPVVPGVIFGPVLQVTTEVSAHALISYRSQKQADPVRLLADYDHAVAQVAESLSTRSTHLTGAAADVLSATAALAQDKGLRSAVRTRLEAGDPLLSAVAAAVQKFTVLFDQMGGLMAERVTDLLDVERRIVARIVGVEEPGLVPPDAPSILVAEDLAPADTAGLDPSLVLALVTQKGGPTSHTAIIARQLGLPCVVGVHDVAAIPSGTVVLVDAGLGHVIVQPDEKEAQGRVEKDRHYRTRLAAWRGPAATADGTAIKLLANIADVQTAETAAAAPVEGVGLFRTELCFLGRSTEPDVETQAALYAGALTPFGDGRTVVIRTLDAGSDKPLPYATHTGEENPALGVRGLRLSFDEPGLLERQLQAIALAAARTRTTPWVMAPMVATVTEAENFAVKVRALGLRAGIMVETPAAALLADQILATVDFVSIGTNDLTQYTMAADRLSSGLAHLTDPWQPAVLRLIAMTAEAGRTNEKPVGVCGEAAADPLLAAVLLGFGVTSLSMAPAAVPAVGVFLETVSTNRCRDAAARVLTASDPGTARSLAREVLTTS